MKRLLFTLALIAFTIPSWAFKVYIFADMEGATGITCRPQILNGEGLAGKLAVVEAFCDLVGALAADLLQIVVFEEGLLTVENIEIADIFLPDIFFQLLKAVVIGHILFCQAVHSLITMVPCRSVRKMRQPNICSFSMTSALGWS